MWQPGAFQNGWVSKKEQNSCSPILEFSYKNDELGDPFINDDYALALGLAEQEEIDTIRTYAKKVNEFLKDIPRCRYEID